MKVRMKDILDRDEKIIIPLYFIGDETDEFVKLDVEGMQDEFNNKLKELEVKDDE